jgi:hypothetical protein
MRVRVFTNGGYAYTIFTFLPYEEIHVPHVNNFFDSFRFTAKVPGNLLSDKSELMLKDIESTDTTVLKEVIPFIEAQNFDEQNVARIQELLLKRFDDDTDTLTSRKIVLLQALSRIGSTSSVEFIRQLYPTLQGNSELEFNALNVLVKLNSKAANDLLVELLPSHQPVKGNIWKYSEIFSSARIDSVDAKNFFVKVLPLIEAEPYKTSLYSYMQDLLRDQRMQFPEVLSYKAMIMSDFKLQYETFTRDTIYQYLDDLITIIGYDKLAKTELGLLRNLAGNQNEYLSIRANASLLRQQQKGDEKRILNLAQNQYYRKDLFKELQDFNLEKFFPAKYLNQDSIAVSDFFTYLSDEYSEPQSMKVVHSEVLPYKGAQKKFFVIEFVDPDDGKKYRGVAGPYAINKIEVFGEATGSTFEESADMDHHAYLLDYISRFEE